MATLTTGKVVEALLDSAVQAHEEQTQMMDLVSRYEPDAAAMQNSNNVIWRPTQQHRPIIDGWDVTGSEQGIIEQMVPATLGTPKNDLIELRADSMRDISFFERAGKEAGRRQASELNKNVAELVRDTGSLFYRSNVTSGFDFVANAQVLLNERQIGGDMRCFALNDRDSLKFASDLAGRQTVQGRPEDVWRKGQIANNVAEFDIYTGSYLPTLAGGADPATTTTAAVSEAPDSGSTSGYTVTNVDSRLGVIPVVATASYSVGDKVTFANGGTTVKALGLADKTNTNQAMTFTIVGIPDGTTLEVFPKPIAADDPGLSTLQKAYANIDTQIGSGATVNRLNIDASARCNAFWTKDSIEVLTGDIPANLLNEFGGMKVVQSTMSNGQKMYLAYNGDIKTMNLSYRLFTWYGTTNLNPSANGVAVTY